MLFLTQMTGTCSSARSLWDFLLGVGLLWGFFVCLLALTLWTNVLFLKEKRLFLVCFGMYYF